MRLPRKRITQIQIQSGTSTQMEQLSIPKPGEEQIKRIEAECSGSQYTASTVCVMEILQVPMC